MKKVLIIYSTKKKLPKLAEAFKEGFETKGYRVEMKSTKDKAKPINFKKYDLIVAGSPILGFFGGKIDDGLKEFLNRCKGTVGQKAIAFVDTKILGQSKALKKVMEELESVGCMVYDFRALADEKAARRYASNL